MAVTIQGHYTDFVSNNGSTNTYSFYAEWSGNVDHDTVNVRYFTGTGFSWNYTPDSTAETGSWYSSLSGHPTGIAMDIDMSWYPSMDVSGRGTFYGNTVVTRTYVIAATASAPSAASITSSSASVSCNFVPNVTASVCTAQLQYKKTTDSTWTNFGSPKTDGTGYGSTAISSISLTGLAASTSYDVRLYISRNTSANTTTTGATTSFVTLAGVPTTTTNAASSVAATSAVLNQTAVINAGTTVTAYWQYGIQNPPTDTTTASQSISADGAYSVATGTLLASTLYYAQAFLAFATPAGTPSSGSVVSFTTSADPVAASLLEDHLTIQEYDAVYGVQKAFVFLAASPSATSSNIFLSAAAPWATTECRITIDGGAVADCTNAPSRIGTSAFYTITLTAGELSGENIWVHINDTGAAARDVALHIRTSLEVGKVVANAAAMATGTSAFLCTGIGAGHGASFVGGATGNDINGVLGSHVIRKAIAQAGGASTITLDASASATNDFYNGALVVVISGTGTAQSRFIVDYDGGTKVATVHRAWGTNPAVSAVFIIVPAEDVWAQAATAELSSIPTATSSWADKIQFLWQRFAYKRTETATVFTMTKADSSTSLGTAAVSDNGTTQSHAKIA